MIHRMALSSVQKQNRRRSSPSRSTHKVLQPQSNRRLRRFRFRNRWIFRFGSWLRSVPTYPCSHLLKFMPNVVFPKDPCLGEILQICHRANGTAPDSGERAKVALSQLLKDPVSGYGITVAVSDWNRTHYVPSCTGTALITISPIAT